MSDHNLDQLRDDWQTLLDSATVENDPAWKFGMIGTWKEENGWHYRPREEAEVRLPTGSPSLGRLRDNFLHAVQADGHEVERIIVLTVGQAKLGAGNTSWEDAQRMIDERLGFGVAAIAIGGVRSSEHDADGAAAPLLLGEHAIAGYLDSSIDRAAAALARRHGLAGFRFSDDSWWAENHVGAKEDPVLGQERLEELAAAGSWPWLSLVVAAPASGVAAEVGAIATAQALLGALVLLDQAPGTGWNEAVPWIAGGLGPAGDPRWPGDTSCDWTLPIAPQHVDAATRRLDNAENDLGGAPTRLIDLAAQVHGPGGDLLTRVVSSSLIGAGDEPLAAACRLAWLAAATETASTRRSLALSASKQLAPQGGEDLLSLAQVGAKWRIDQAAGWPERDGFGPEPNLDAWLARMPDAAANLTEELASPSWGAKAAGQAGRALGLVQALFFGHAAKNHSD